MNRSLVRRIIRIISTQTPDVILAKVLRRIRIYFHFIMKKPLKTCEPEKLAVLLENRQNARFFIEPNNRERTIQTIRREYPSAESLAIKAADKTLSHTFDILDSGDIHLGADIDWHRDFKSGRAWPLIHYSKIDTIQSENGSDIKIPWEFNRCHHFIALGKAYWYTTDEKYAREWVAQMDSWIRTNPVEFGINWACAMEVSIRIVNWIWAYYFFFDSPSFTYEVRIRFSKALIEHYRFIIQNLENIGWRNNHYLANLAALAYISVLFPGIKGIKKYFDFMLAELTKEIKGQFYPDGVNCEGSINYHRLSLEIVTSAISLLKLNDIEISSDVKNRLQKAFEYISAYTKPDGNAPQVGDNDNGRLHILSEYTRNNPDDHRYLLAIGSVLFKTKYTGFFYEEAFWLLGHEGLDEFEGLDKTSAIRNAENSAFKDAGIYVMKENDLYMMVDVGTSRQKGSGGHSHNDNMSFELYAHDKTFIIDPGTYTYTADLRMRDLFRSTKYHNTATVDDKEISDMEISHPFFLKDMSSPRISRWEVSDKEVVLEAEHRGYCRLSSGITHMRRIYFDKQEGLWLIKDSFIGEGSHKFDLYFHFAPIEIIIDNNNPMAVRTRCTGANLYLCVEGQEGLSLKIVDGWISHRYGNKNKGPIAHYSKIDNAPVTFLTTLRPSLPHRKKSRFEYEESMSGRSR